VRTSAICATHPGADAYRRAIALTEHHEEQSDAPELLAALEAT
jgi:hypothetical protein